MGRAHIRRSLLEKMPKGANCAEIGVWDGGFSEQILDIAEPKTLHLIDPWCYQPEFNNSAFGKKVNRNKMDEKFEAVSAKFNDDPRVRIHRATSHDALAQFQNGELDWVYVDGNHNYQIISKDLELCLEKVKLDGIISGDDFFWKPDKGSPVKRAVLETVSKLGGEVQFSRTGQQYFLKLQRHRFTN